VIGYALGRDREFQQADGPVVGTHPPKLREGRRPSPLGHVVGDPAGGDDVEGVVHEREPSGVARDRRHVGARAGAVPSRQRRPVAEDDPVVEHVEADHPTAVGQVRRQPHQRPAGATPHVERAVRVV